MSVAAVIGTVAATLTTMSFIPQILKLRRQGGRDLSYSMLFLFGTGVSLWLIYGLMIHAAAVIWANVLAVVFVALCIVLKATVTPAINSESQRLRIAVDMDEVIADSFTEHLRRFNEQVNANLTKEMIAENGLRPSIPEEHHETFSRVPFADGFFADLDLIEGSRKALEQLSHDHDVFIASAAMDVPTSFDAKYKWLQKHFPFIPPSRIVFCGDKHILNADVLIDDRSRHFKKFEGIGILFTAPHNAKEAAPLRANGWNQVLQILSAHNAKAPKGTRKPRMFSMNPAES